LVIATSVHAASPVQTVADLHKAKFRRMGIGNPKTVGVGHYAEQALRKMGLWQELQPRLVFSQSGCELLKWLGLGRDIDAAVVFSLCVNDEPGSVRQAAPPVPVLLSVAQQAPNQPEARRFIDFARQAAEILRKYRVEPEGAAPSPQS
jgi:molybdate transport system substrate-binding protein